MAVLYFCLAFLFLGQNAPQMSDGQLISLYQAGVDSLKSWDRRGLTTSPLLSDVAMDLDYGSPIGGIRLHEPDSLVQILFGIPRFIRSDSNYALNTSKTLFYSDIAIHVDHGLVTSFALLTPKYKNGHGICVGMPISEVLRLYSLSSLPNTDCGAIYVSRIQETVIMYRNAKVWQIVNVCQH